MAKYLIPILSILIHFTVNAQEGFRLTGSVHDSLNGKFIHFYGIDYSGSNKPVRDSVKIVNGIFEYTGSLTTPALLTSVYIKEIPMFFGQIFLENKHIQLKVTPGKPYRFETTNNPVTAQYLQWRAATSDPFIKMYPLMNSIDSLRNAGADTSLIAEQEKTLHNFQQLKRQAEIEFVNTNPDVYLSLYWLSYSLFHSMQQQPAQLQSLYENLSPALKALPEAKEFEHKLATLQQIKPGYPAPLFSAPSPEGKSTSLEQFRGKYVLLDFWASWCGPCLEKIPELKRIHKEYGAKLDILGISLDQDKEKWITAINKYQLNWHHVSELKYWSGNISKSYNISAIPATMLIGPDGNILAINPDLGKDLSKYVK